MTHDRAAFAGQIADVRVHDLLSTILDGRHTGLAKFQTEIGSATLWFRDGELIDAEMGRHVREAAVRRLLPLTTGTFEVEFKSIDRRVTIDTSTAALVAEYRARQDAPSDDEAETIRKPSPTGPLKRRRAAAGWQPTAGASGRAEEPASARDRLAPEALTRSPIQGARPAAPTSEPTSEPTVDATDSGEAIASPEPESSARRPASMRHTQSFARPVPIAGSVVAEPVARSKAPVADKDAIDRLAALSRAAPVPQDALLGELAPTTTTSVPQFAPPSRTGATQPPADTAAPASTTMRGPIDTFATERGQPDPPAAAAAPAGAVRPDERGETPQSIDDEGSDPMRRSGRHRRPAAARSVPFEPERIDRTLMRAAPFPPAVGEPTPDKSKSQSVIVLTPTPAASSDSPAAVGPARTGATVAPASREPARGATMSPPSATRGKTERFELGAGPRGTFVLPPEASDEAAPVVAAFGEAPRPVQWPDSTPIEIAPVPTTPAPAIVGRYEVLLRIARGGMGTVYLCRVTGEGGFRRLFALKVIRDHLSANPEYVAMLLQEARFASRLHHPNVVSIVDIGTLANQHYLVMDYVEGCTFSELLKAHPQSRPPHLVVPIVIDALTGLHAAHTLTEDDGRPFPLVHCDFSPQNMLVGANGICRITDFGIAKAADALPDITGVTRGKPGFLSPEQVLGQPIDHRSDVFAAGVVLWNALTGERLFDGATPEQTLEMVLHKPIPRPSAVGLRPPAWFDAICLTALERDPNRRYQTAEQMLVELRKAAVSHDMLGAQSDVAKWVQDTFGHQIELRRQAAGIARRPVPGQLTALALAHVGAASGGHIADARRDGSDTSTVGAGSSRTELLRSDIRAPQRTDVLIDTDGIGRAVRLMVFVLSALAAGACIAVLFLRPDWLRGGVLDDSGVYHPWVPPPVEPVGDQLPATEREPATTAKPDEPVAQDTADEPGSPVDPAAPDDPEAAPTGPGRTHDARPSDTPASVPPPARDNKRDASKDKPKRKKPRDDVASDDAPAEPAPLDPAKPEPNKPEPSKPEPSKPEPTTPPPPPPPVAADE